LREEEVPKSGAVDTAAEMYSCARSKMRETIKIKEGKVLRLSYNRFQWRPGEAVR
jgi:hypothetical protein